MNNCPKCGNPLQNGATSCPVCGTSFVVATPVQSNAVTQTPVTNNNVNVSPVQQPVQPTQPVQQPVAQVQPQQQVVQQPVLVSSAPQQAVQKPVAIPVVPQQNIQQPVVGSVPSQPVQKSVQTVSQQVASSPNVNSKNLAKKSSIKINSKMILIIALIVIVVIAIVVFSGGKKTKKTVVNNQTVEYVNVVSNGFRFKANKDWFVLAGNSVVVIKDDDSSIMVKLEKYDSSFDNYSKANIEKYLNTKDDLVSDFEVTETTIESTPVIIVKAKVAEAEKHDVEYYYLKAGEKIVIGATAIYLKDSKKADNSEMISSLVSSLSYSDDNSIALKEVNEYINTFGIYGNILGHSNTWYEESKQYDEIENQDEDENDESNDNEQQENDVNGEDYLD